MLVLGRREGETLVFPDLDIVLEVLAIKGNTARLGVKAPSKFKVLRGELAESRRKVTAWMDRSAEELSRERMHRIRNWLHLANLRMQLIRRYLEADRLDEAAELIQNVLDDFRAIEDDNPRPSAAPTAVETECFSAPARPSGAATRRALLVEDNANERQLLAGYLRTSGFDVATAGDGVAALDYLSSRERPDVVLLDMVMPDCDGPTLLRKIRGNRSFEDLKVFAVSGTSPSNWNISTGPTGVDRWFRKPVDPQVLVCEITRELERPKPR